jgi:predicted dehydrogenase
MKTFRFALIGCGAISKKHLATIIENNERINLIAVCDIDEKRATAAANYYRETMRDKETKQIQVYTDHKELLEKERPEIVAVATASFTHFLIARDCLESGAHVIIEKPVALSTKETDEIERIAGEKGLKTAVCYITRFEKQFLALKDALQKEQFGKLFGATLQVYWNRSEQYYKEASWRGTWDKDGGMLMNQCTHGIDLLQWVLGGDVSKVYGILKRHKHAIETEDFASAILEFKNGCIGTIQATVDVYPSNLEESLSIFGETGTVVIGGKALDTVKVWKFKDVCEEEELKIIKELNTKDSTSGHAALYRDFINCVIEGKKSILDIQEGRKASDIVLAIYKSSLEKKNINLPVDFSTREMKAILS